MIWVSNEWSGRSGQLELQTESAGFMLHAELRAKKGKIIYQNYLLLLPYRLL